MRIELVNSSIGASEGRQYSMSCIVDQRVAIDAGCIGYLAPLARQRQIQHVFLSHSHLDHVGSLPIFLDNVYRADGRCPTVYGSGPVWECLQKNVFNDRLWPDVLRLAKTLPPFLHVELLESGKTIVLDDLSVTPWALQHVVPTVGFLIQDHRAAVATVWDTLPTDEIWDRLREQQRLRALFVEASFPNAREQLARTTGHLTPALLAAELQKLQRDVRVIVVHIKPAFQETIAAELNALGLPNLEIGQPGKTYEF